MVPVYRIRYDMARGRGAEIRAHTGIYYICIYMNHPPLLPFLISPSSTTTRTPDKGDGAVTIRTLTEIIISQGQIPAITTSAGLAVVVKLPCVGYVDNDPGLVFSC